MLAERFVVVRTSVSAMHSTCLLRGALKVPFHVPIMRHTRPCGQLWESLPIAGNGATWVSSVTLSEDFGLSLHTLKPALDSWSILRLPLPRLYHFRLDVDYDVMPLSITWAEECVNIAELTITEVSRLANGARP